VRVWDVEASSVEICADCGETLVLVCSVVGIDPDAVGVEAAAAMETDSAAADTEAESVALLLLDSTDSVVMKTELNIESFDNTGDADEDADKLCVTRVGVPVRLIGTTVKPATEMTVVLEGDAEAGGEDSASADACAATVDGAADPVTVSMPVSLSLGDAVAVAVTVWEAESVLGCGGITIVSEACDEGVDTSALALLVDEAEAEGGKAETGILDNPFTISELVVEF